MSIHGLDLPDRGMNVYGEEKESDRRRGEGRKNGKRREDDVEDDERFRYKILFIAKHVTAGSSDVKSCREDTESMKRFLFHRSTLHVPVLILSIAYVFMAYFETPRWDGETPYPNFLDFTALSVIEGLFVMALTADALYEASFRVLVPWNAENIWAWLRSDRWTAVRFVVLGFIVLDYIIWVATPLPIRISVLFRPVLVLSRMSWMKTVTASAFHTIAAASTVLVLIAIHLFWFACIGFWLFHDDTYRHHVRTPKETGQEYCDVFYPKGCTDYFFSVPEALYTMFITLTTVNFPDVMIPYFEIGGWNAFFAALYFLSFYVIGLYFLMNLLLATVYNDFRESTKRYLIKKTKRRKKWIDRLWSVLVTRFGNDREDEKEDKDRTIDMQQWKHFYALVRPKLSGAVADAVFVAITLEKHQRCREGRLLERLRRDGGGKDEEEKEEEGLGNGEKRVRMTISDFSAGWQFLQLQNVSRVNQVMTSSPPSSPSGSSSSPKRAFGALQEGKAKNTDNQSIEKQQEKTHDDDDDFDDDIRPCECMPKSEGSFCRTLRIRCMHLFKNRVVNLVTDSLVVVNAAILVLLLEQDGTTQTENEVLIACAIALLVFFVFEMIFRLVASGGLVNFWNENSMLLKVDLVAVVVSCISMVLRLAIGEDNPRCGSVSRPCGVDVVDQDAVMIAKILGVIQLSRTLRLVRFFLREFGVAVRILRSLAVYILWFFCALYPCVVLSNVIFADSLRLEDERVQRSVYGIHEYWNLNFRTFGSSFIVLWHQLVVNNWPIVAAGCEATLGRSARIFFVVYHIYAVLIVLNIIISIIIEMYSMVYEYAGTSATSKIWKRILSQAIDMMGERGETLRRTCTFRMPSTTGRLVRNIFYSELPSDLQPLLRLDQMRSK